MLGEQEEEAREPGIPIVHAIGKQVSRQAMPSSLMAGGEEGDDNPITAELAVRSQRGRKEVGARAKGRQIQEKKPFLESERKDLKTPSSSPRILGAVIVKLSQSSLNSSIPIHM